MKQDYIQHNLKCLFNGPDPFHTHAARYLKVLAHPDRMKILWYLNYSEKSVNDLVNYTNIKQTTLSQHLSLLKDRELVESRREGSYVFYRLLNPKVMDIFAMTHDMYCDTQQPRHDLEAESSFHTPARGFLLFTCLSKRKLFQIRRFDSYSITKAGPTVIWFSTLNLWMQSPSTHYWSNIQGT